MTYSPNIPQSTDDPSQSQPLILSNFQQLNTQFGTDPAGSGGDHVFYTASSNNGKHNRVTLLDESAAAAAVKQAGLNQCLIYGSTSSGITMPYYTRDNIAAATTTWPLAPIKAFVRFTTTGVAGAQTINQSFNITSVIRGAPDPANSYRITFTNAMRTTDYGVLISLGPITGIGGYSTLGTASFLVDSDATTSNNMGNIFSVILIEV